MANSIKTFTWGAGDSASTQYTLPDHFEAADIRVYVNDVLKVQGTDYSYNTTTINFNAGYLPTTDDVITVERNTQNNQRLVDFSDGSILKADTLDKDSNQIFYMAQEAYDQARVTNMASGQFYYSQVDAPTDPVAGTLWYNKSKTPNVLEIYDGSEWYTAAPVKVVQTFTQADTTAISGIYDSLSGANWNSSSEVYLNGVKLVKGEEFADLGNNADYYYDYVQSKLVLGDLAADDILEVITFQGGYSTEVTAKEAIVSELHADFITKYNLVDPKLDDVIALDLPTNQPIIEAAAATATAQAAIATQKAIETSDPLNGWLALDNETVITRSNVDPEIRTSRPFEIDAKSIELTSSDRVVKANGAPLPIASGALKLNGTVWTGTTTITVTSVAADATAPARYRLAGLPEFEDTDNSQVLATYNQEGFGFTNQTGHTVRIGKYNDHLDLFVEFDNNGTYSTATNGTVFLTIYKF